MIRIHTPFDNDDPSGFTALTDKFAESSSDLSFQDVISVFGNPDKVVFDIRDGMASSPVVNHYPSPLSHTW